MSFCFRNINCPASVPQQDFWIKFGAGEGIRIHHSLQVSQVIQQILRKVY